MSRVGRASLLIFVGALVSRLVVDGGFGWFVQQHMRYPLGIAAGALVVFGVYELVQSARYGDESDHGAGPTVGWLLAIPLLVLMSVAPTALGAEAAERVEAYVPTEATDRFTPLPEQDGPLPMRVIEFLDRAAWDTEQSLNGRLIQLEGLVVNDPEISDGFKLTRFMVSCCAADGIPLQVALRGVDGSLEDDTWVIADVVWRTPDVPYHETGDAWIIEADAVLVTPVVGIPKDPYESPY